MDRQRPQDMEMGAGTIWMSGRQERREDRTREDPGCQEDVGIQE